jgi:hypothetical protein
MDEVRFLIGDTDSAQEQLSNEEINFALLSKPPKAAAAECARAIAAKYARLVTRSVGDLNVTYRELQDNYAKLADRLDAASAAEDAGTQVFAGGIFTSDRVIQDNNTSINQPDFRRDQFDNYSGPRFGGNR